MLGRQREAFFKKCDKRRQKQFEVFSVKEKGEHLVASKWRWDDCQRKRKSPEETAWKESQKLEEEEMRKWCAAYEDAARKMPNEISGGQ